MSSRVVSLIGAGLLLLAIALWLVRTKSPVVEPPTPPDTPQEAAAHESGLPKQPALAAAQRLTQPVELRIATQAIGREGTALLPGTTVVAWRLSDRAVREVAWTGTTDSNGFASIPLHEAPVEVFARKSGYVGARVLVSEADLRAAQRVSLNLSEFARLLLRVHDKSGAPLSETRVSVEYPPDVVGVTELMVGSDIPARPLLHAKTDAAGVARVQSIVPGLALSARATAADGSHAAVTVKELLAGEERSVTIVLEPRLTVTATIRDTQGTPLPRAQVAAFAVGKDELRGELQINANESGFARLPGLTPGSVQLVASAWDASGSVLNLLSAVASGINGEIVSLGDLRPEGHSVQMRIMLESPDAGNRLARCYFSRTEAPPGAVPDSQAGEPTWQVVLPFNRPFHVSGLRSGVWSILGAVRMPGSQELDPSFDAIRAELKVPKDNTLTIDVHRRSSSGSSEGALVRFRVDATALPRSSGRTFDVLVRVAGQAPMLVGEAIPFGSTHVLEFTSRSDIAARVVCFGGGHMAAADVDSRSVSVVKLEPSEEFRHMEVRDAAGTSPMSLVVFGLGEEGRVGRNALFVIRPNSSGLYTLPIITGWTFLLREGEAGPDGRFEEGLWSATFASERRLELR